MFLVPTEAIKRVLDPLELELQMACGVEREANVLNLNHHSSSLYYYYCF